MSIETVLNNCLQTAPSESKNKLLADIKKEMARFEKIVKTSFNATYGATYKTLSLDKNAYFEKHKQGYIHKHLEILIDLYDYKQ